MEKDKIYKGGCYIVYKQRAEDFDSVEYSLDQGKTWQCTPADLGKIDYMSAWYRLRDNV